MDASSIFNMARELAGNVSSTNPSFTDSALLKYAQIARHEIENSIITRVDEDFFYRTFKVNTTANEYEYNFQTSTSTQIGMKKILSAGIKYLSTDTYYKPIYPCPTNNFDKYIDELRDTNNTSKAFFTLKNSSLFLYPAPVESVENWLTVEAIVTLPDLTTTSTEADIFPNSELRDYHYVIALGIVPYIHKILRQWTDVSMSKSEYNQALEKMINEVGERYDNTTDGALPSGNQYK